MESKTVGIAGETIVLCSHFKSSSWFSLKAFGIWQKQYEDSNAVVKCVDIGAKLSGQLHILTI